MNSSLFLSPSGTDPRFGLRAKTVFAVVGLLMLSLLSVSSAQEVASTPGTSLDTKAKDDEFKLEQFVVTGRAGIDDRPKVQTSYSISTESAEQIRMRSPMGIPEALKSIPGFWVEASGGEASANIRARGIPTEGYSTVSVLEDGLPIQHDPGLGYLNA